MPNPYPFPEQSTPQKRAKTRGLPLLIFLLIVAAALGVATSQKQAIVDWWQLRNYHAPTTVSQLATQDTMTDYSRHVFYVNQPSIRKADFNDACPNNGGEKTIVLGCYHGGQNGIFLLDVTDSRLDGVEQVTAAHEMLHAAYDRLSSKERTRVDAMLEDYYTHDLHDPRLQATVAAYKKSEPNDVVNEMHSVFGTEVANLPSGLEAYYKKYFTDRQKVAGYAARYQAEFSSRQATVQRDDATLATMKTQIEAGEAQIKSGAATITTQREALLRLQQAGQTSQYNAAVPAFNALIDSYNATVANVKQQIDSYNQLVAARNSVALEEDQLANDLNAKAQTIKN